MNRSCAAKVSACVAVALFSSAAGAALPVIPGASGFGVETPAGRGGKVFKVTSLAESGAGTLAECVLATGPRVCVFEVAGVIWLSDDLRIRNPFLTIAGQTAPSPGIQILGAGLGIHASDVLVQHISVRPGDKLAGPAPNVRDALAITHPSTKIERVVVANCSFGWSVDEMMSVQGYWNKVSLINNLFAEPLNDSIHPDGPHGYGSLSGPTASGQSSFIGNLFAHAVGRNVYSRTREMAFVNNVVYNFSDGTDLQSEGYATFSSVVGNVYIKGPSSPSGGYSVQAAGGTRTLIEGSKIFVKDNIGYTPDGAAVTLTSDPWSIVRNMSGLSRTSLEASTPPTWPAGLVSLVPGKDDVVGLVLQRAGSHPGARSAADARIIGHVKNKTGGYINCVAPDGSSRCAKNAGGWPDYAPIKRSLDLPPNPSADDDGDGYTNLEEWLHDLAAQVEGRSTARPNPPVVVVE